MLHGGDTLAPGGKLAAVGREARARSRREPRARTRRERGAPRAARTGRDPAGSRRPAPRQPFRPCRAIGLRGAADRCRRGGARSARIRRRRRRVPVVGACDGLRLERGARGHQRHRHLSCRAAPSDHSPRPAFLCPQHRHELHRRSDLRGGRGARGRARTSPRHARIRPRRSTGLSQRRWHKPRG